MERSGGPKWTLIIAKYGIDSTHYGHILGEDAYHSVTCIQMVDVCMHG